MTTHIGRQLRKLDPFANRDVGEPTRSGMRNLWFDNLWAAISGAFLMNYVSLYALSFGASNAQIGALSSIASLLGMVAPLPGARLAARWGSRRQTVVRVWVVIRTLAFTLSLIPFFLNGDAAIYAVIAIWSLRAGLVNLANPAWVSLSGDVIPAERRGRFFSNRNIAMAAASMVCIPLAGQLIDWGGDPRGYQWSFALSALLGFVALYFFRQIPEPESAPQAPAKPKPKRLALPRSMGGNRTFLLYGLIAVLWNLSLQVGGPYFTVYQVKVLGVTPKIMGWLSMVMSISTVAGQWFWGRVVDRKGARWVKVVSSLTIPLLPTLWFFLRGPWDVIWVRIPSGFLWAGFNLSSFNLLLELPDEKERTQAAAGYMTLISIANIIGPLIGGWVVERVDYLWDFALSGAGRLIAGILFMFLLKPFKRTSKETQ